MVVVAVWLIGFVNAFNFMDGVNGISAAHAADRRRRLRLPGRVAPGRVPGPGRALPSPSGALAFLPWNAVRARVFLGDVGSYGLGAALAVLAACAVFARHPAGGLARPARAVPGRHRHGPCSGASGPASGSLKPTARTPTSGCATSAGHTSG